MGCHCLLRYLGARHCYRNLDYVVIQLLSCVQLFLTSWTAACQAYQFFTISLCLLRLMAFESVMPSNHLILCYPFLLVPISSIRVFSSELALHIRWSTVAIQTPVAISPLFPGSILDTYQPGCSSFSVKSFFLFILFMGFSRQEY